MQPEGRDHALNFEKMIGLQFEHAFVDSCELHVRHYEDESRLFGYFFNVTGKIMCWHCGNPGVFRSGMLDEDMEAVVKAYAVKEGKDNYRLY